MAGRFVIMRKPVIMEDAGRHFYIRTEKTKEGAKKWIAAQAGEYFRPGDYYIIELEED